MSQSSAAPLSQGAQSSATAAPADPTQGADDGSGSPQGTVIYMALQADGSIQVGMQDSDADDQGGASDGDVDSQQPQTFTDPDQALQAAGQLLQQAMQGGSQDDGSQATPPASGDAMMPPDQATQVWKQMASQKNKAKAKGM